MHQWSLPELRGSTPPQRGASTPQTSGPVLSWSRGSRGDDSGCSRPPRSAPLWVWLLLGVLVVPGARSFLSDEQEELLVELHNHYRGQVSPSASAMLPLRWDPSLKVIAEGYAAKCVWNHNPELEDTGENLFAGTGPLDLRLALEKWFLEHLDYDYLNNSCDEDKMCGHYTQMVWADTHKVGCAFHLCNTMEGLDWERVSFLVCNYFPAGNYEGERPYVEGDRCSRCPENMQRCANNLCVADIVEEDDDAEVTDEVTADPSLPPPEVTSTETVAPPTETPADPHTDPTTNPSTYPPADPTVQLTTTGAPSLSSTSISEDTPPPATTTEASPPPDTPSEPQDKEDREEDREEDRQRKAPGKIPHSILVSVSAGSVPSASVLLFLTWTFILRL